MSKALSDHLAARNASFASLLVKAADHAPRETFQEIDAQLESAIENLRQVAEMTLKGQKESAESLLGGILARTRATISAHQELMSDLLAGQPPLEDGSVTSEYGSVSEPDVTLNSGEWVDQLLCECKTLFSVFNLRDGESGWSFAKIFDSKIFIGSEKIRVVDPYLLKHHQLRNLKELVLHIVDCSKPKTIEVLTSVTPLDQPEVSKGIFETLGKDLFDDYGVTLNVINREGLHDRYVFSDAGFVVKLGRGLDIYKPSTGLASHRQESRKVRACDVTILAR